MKEEFTEPTLEDVLDAAERIKDHAHRTPVLTSRTLNRIANADIYFKCENFQKVGAFKFRGAFNAVDILEENELKNGVATHSSGNHAQALALAARIKGIPAYIVMPKNAPGVKVEAVKNYGGIITFCEPTLEAREKTLEKVIKRTGATFIHPYNNFYIIAGQATIGLELIEEIPELDVIMGPIGGGGLMSGTAIITDSLSPETKTIGVEPTAADDAYRSLKAGKIIRPEKPDTIADGLRTALSPMTFGILKNHLHKIVTVSESAIVQAMQLIWERMKIIVEPSAAVPFAALLEKREEIDGQKIGIILSGGNVDLHHLPW